MNAKIITIDGSSGVGKGTLAKTIAQTYGYHCLDSGALYRIVAYNAKQQGLNVDTTHEAVLAAQNLSIQFHRNGILLNGSEIEPKIRTLAIGQMASKVAVHQEVRDTLFEFMKNFLTSPGIVADGRDMGTTVFPKADLKIFLIASAEIRAERRYKQLIDNGKDAILSVVLSEITERDKRDISRDNSPLEPAKDAIIIDTGNLTATQVFECVKHHAEQKGIQPI